MRILVLVLFQVSEASVLIQMNLLKGFTKRKQVKDQIFRGDYNPNKFESEVPLTNSLWIVLPSSCEHRSKAAEKFIKLDWFS